MPGPTGVLIFGRDQLLLQTRAWLLEQAGHSVETSMDTAALPSLLGVGRAELLVLCHTLSSEDRRHARATAHASGVPVQILVLVAPQKAVEAEPEEALLSSLDGPAKLIATVQRLVGRGHNPLPPRSLPAPGLATLY